MRLIDIFRIAARMIRTNILRSSLTIGGIGIAISFIVILIGFGYGIQNITIGSIVESKTLLSLDILGSNTGNLALNDETVKKVAAMPGVETVTPVVTTTGQAESEQKLAVVSVTAANIDFFDMEGLTLATGERYKDDSVEMNISAGIAELFDVKDPAELIGKKITVAYADPNNQNDLIRIEGVTVVGVLAKIDSPAIYLPYRLMTAKGPVKINALKAVAADRDAVVKVSADLVKLGYQVDSLIETLDQAKKVFSYVTIGLGVFGTISLIVAAIGMFNTLTIALLERTREIGIMKAIGVTDIAIKQLFLAEAGMLGFMGGLFGISLGLAIDNSIELLLRELAKRFDGTQLNLFQYPNFFLFSMLLYPIILALITGFYPAIRASKLNPLKALRYE